MEIIKNIVDGCKEYRWELFLAICLFSNLYSQLPIFLYYVVWMGFMYMKRKTNAQNAGKRAQITNALIVVIVLSSLVNGAIYDYRWIMMCILLYVTMQKTSYDFFVFKERFLFVCMMLFVISGPLNWYAHLIGYNYQLYYGLHAGQTYTIDFSGFANNPMWLSAACGIGLIAITYIINHLWSNGYKFYSFFLLPVAFMSLQTLVWGGSRSAFGISIAASLLYIVLANNSNSTKILSIVFIGMLASVVIPIIMEDSERMQTKKGGLNLVDKQGETSRTALWNQRIDEFESSPVWGIGFGTTGIGNKAKTGRAETGSGWLSVLAQTGLIGIILVVFLVRLAKMPVTMLRENKHMALYTSVLVFFCFHTIFEAYLFQSGWYLCFVFWTIVSTLDDFKLYYENEADVN